MKNEYKFGWLPQALPGLDLKLGELPGFKCCTLPHLVPDRLDMVLPDP